MNTSRNQALLIFIKNPEKGKVKTRLAETLGDDKALEVYQKLLSYTRKVTRQVEADRQVWYSKFIDEDDEWLEENFTARKQRGASLGERMKHAFFEAFGAGYEKAVIIGSDCAQLLPQHIENAYRELETTDVVIGPSDDGGYYLLGMNKFYPVFFENKSWSTKHVFSQTLQDFDKHNLRYSVLEKLNDVDTETDWEEVKNQFNTG